MDILNDTEETRPFNKSLVNNQTCDPVSTSADLVFLLVYSLVFLVGLLLNSFTMKFYFCGAQQQVSSSLMVYLKNLTAADFLLCLCLPLRITNYASSSNTIHLIYCSFGATGLFLNMYASILFMGYIAANRYLKIVHPLGTHILQTVRGAHIISRVTWVCLFTFAMSYIILFFINPKQHTSKYSRCDSIFNKQVNVLDKVIHAGATIIFLLILISLVFFYYSTSRRVIQAQQRQLASSGSQKLMKARRNMSVLVSVFCVCFVPYHLVRLPYTLLWWSCSVIKALFYLKEVTVTASVLNICLDPVVYFFLCKAFRAQVSLRTASRTARVNIHQGNRERESSEEQLDIATMNTSQSSGL